MSESKKISFESGGIAAFTLIQILIEKLVALEVLTQDDAYAVIDESVHLNERALPAVHGSQNSDAVYLLEQLRGSLEQGWTENQ